ncbi:2-octaprenyl-6-methoxyphenyl hydroxylase [Alteromonas pelagimontana]|uniref:2-octaprenyl-6-methoxyphenyl hydroxylase n=1 Tax=Alteromonas pelagimontana TaxID=1858656 RepID=A0A6M4MBS5_9ALTE|nr:2-octaprenyl-6-methoxyphenyl hydroxylase [Alteromonas pelagimontana]QJR79985.1 2-octaprenyl-6-methoxyphenyl hydroxylase [Alteromonas pelagimontana]
MTKPNRTDVVIVGGGTVGNIIARGLLANTDFSIALVEAKPFQPDSAHPGFDARVMALAKRTVDELHKLGVDCRRATSVPIHQIQVSDQGSLGLCHLRAEDFGNQSFGEVVALSTLGKLLHDGLAHPRLEVITPATVNNIEQHQDEVTLTLSNGQTLHSRLMVIADGGRSNLTQQSGLTRHVQSYGQTAITCNVLTSQPHHHRAYERFTADGPLAFLPFSPAFDGRTSTKNGFSVVWTVPPEKAGALCQLEGKKFIHALQAAFGYRQGKITRVGDRTAYPLSLQYADSSIAQRVAIAGNAAQTLHPIAGQGFNLGLRDAIDLVDVLSQGKDPGAYATLRQYSKKREADRRATISLTDSMVRLFSNNTGPLKAGRNLALLAMNNTQWLKQRFVLQTTGYGPHA